MSLIRWDPFDDLASLRESMDKLFEEFVTRRPAARGATIAVWQPAVEIFETDNEVVVRPELPGIDPKTVDITVSDDTLTIKGEHRVEQENEGPELLPARAALRRVPSLAGTARGRSGRPG